MRPGHHRPLGTTTWMRFTDWPGGREPQLGDVICQISGAGADDWATLRRFYRVNGIEQTRTGFRLLAERVEYGTIPENPDPDALWPFYNTPRSPA